MHEIIIEAENRARTGRHSRALRREGMVPGIYYIRGEANIPFTVTGKSLQPLIYTTESHIINLKFNDGGVKKCILREVQFDPVTEKPIHVDLLGLRENEEITLEVPVVVTGGTPVGVREGGILQQSIRALKVSCLPKNIPNHIEVNAGELKMNEFIHVRDIRLPDATILAHEEDTILGVIPPTVEKEVAVEPGAEVEAAEPEVIGKGKKPEEGEEAAEAEGKAEAGKAAAPAKAATQAKTTAPGKATPPGKTPASPREEKKK
ncbi:MAG TPA: 50S ribosomal protein L25 [Bacteroidota bacterium]|nr:50S ribosomal protein L25 [Bacteroidota bacterium]